MKKLVAVVLTLYLTFVSFVLVAGYIQKHSREDSLAPSATSGVRPNVDSNTPYSVAVVSQHSARSSCWLIINQNVYDVSRFLSQHPGGDGTILPYCGREATHAFDTRDQSFGSHSSGAARMLRDYQIGKIAP